MRRIIGLSCVFILCFLIDVVIPQSEIAMPVVGYAPFICVMMGRSKKAYILVMALLVGLVHDLFSLQHRLGITSIAYITCVILAFPFQRRYYEEKIIPFFCVTYFISLSYSLFFLFFGAFKGLLIDLNFSFFKYQILLNPLFDSLIGSTGVFIPVKVYSAIKKIILRRSYAP